MGVAKNKKRRGVVLGPQAIENARIKLGKDANIHHSYGSCHLIQTTSVYQGGNETSDS